MSVRDNRRLNSADRSTVNRCNIKILPVLDVLLLLLLFNGGELLKAESDSAVVELHFVDRLRASSAAGWLRSGSWNFLATGGGAMDSMSSSMTAVSGLAAQRLVIQSSTIFLTLGGRGRLGRPAGDARLTSGLSPSDPLHLLPLSPSHL